MQQTKKEVVLEFPLHGFDKSDIDIKIGKNSLMIRATRKNKKKIQRKEFFHFEKSSQKFSYATTLPEVDDKKAKITFKEGILKIKIPKK